MINTYMIGLKSNILLNKNKVICHTLNEYVYSRIVNEIMKFRFMTKENANLPVDNSEAINFLHENNINEYRR